MLYKGKIGLHYFSQILGQHYVAKITETPYIAKFQIAADENEHGTVMDFFFLRMVQSDNLTLSHCQKTKSLFAITQSYFSVLVLLKDKIMNYPYLIHIRHIIITI